MLLTLLQSQGAPAGTQFHARVSGVWKPLTLYVRVAGVWKLLTMYIRVSGVWK